MDLKDFLWGKEYKGPSNLTEEEYARILDFMSEVELLGRPIESITIESVKEKKFYEIWLGSFGRIYEFKPCQECGTSWNCEQLNFDKMSVGKHPDMIRSKYLFHKPDCKIGTAEFVLNV